jgi:hypothetical protein
LTPLIVPAVAVGQIVGVVAKERLWQINAVPLVFSGAFGHLCSACWRHAPAGPRSGDAMRQVFHVEHDRLHAGTRSALSRLALSRLALQSAHTLADGAVGGPPRGNPRTTRPAS